MAVTDTPTLLTLLRRVEKLRGPEVPSPRTFDASRPISLQHSQVMVVAGIYAAVLRDHAAGPVVEWFDNEHKIDILFHHVMNGEWEVRIDGKYLDPLPRDQAILATLAAALEKVETDND